MNIHVIAWIEFHIASKKEKDRAENLVLKQSVAYSAWKLLRL